MDARGMVAVIFTMHEGAALLGALTAAIVLVLGAILLRRMSPGRRALTLLAFALGGALVTFATTSRVLGVHAFDVELVRVSS